MSQSSIEAVNQLEHLGFGRVAAPSEHLLIVEADDLLLLANHAHFTQRHNTMVHGEQIDPGVNRAPPEHAPTLVGAHQRDQRGFAPERHDIGSCVCGSAQNAPRAVDPQYGNGASGEIRLHSPSRYSSRIASPITSTRRRPKSLTYAAVGSLQFVQSHSFIHGGPATQQTSAVRHEPRQTSVRRRPSPASRAFRISRFVLR